MTIQIPLPGNAPGLSKADFAGAETQSPQIPRTGQATPQDRLEQVSCDLIEVENLLALLIESNGQDASPMTSGLNLARKLVAGATGSVDDLASEIQQKATVQEVASPSFKEPLARQSAHSGVSAPSPDVHGEETKATLWNIVDLCTAANVLVEGASDGFCDTSPGVSLKAILTAISVAAENEAARKAGRVSVG